MSRRRPMFLRRAIANEERRHGQTGGEAMAQGAAFRWAAVGVALVVALGVMVGFTDYGQALAARFSQWPMMSRRIVFGITVGDLLVLFAVAIAVALFLWRDWRRARRRFGR